MKHWSLDDYLLTIINIYALLGRLAAEAAAIKVIPCVVMIRAIRVVRGCYSRFFVVAEFQHDAAGVGVIGGEAVQLEVGSASIVATGTAVQVAAAISELTVAVAAYPVIGTAQVRLCIQVFQIRCYIII